MSGLTGTKDFSSSGPTPAILRGAVTLPRSRSTPENKPWRKKPPSFFGPQTEWACYWYLSIHGIAPNDRKLREGRDYFYQRGLTAPGLFLRKPFTRGDFVIPGFGKLRKGVVFDPLTPFTHKEYWFDLQKRRILALQGWQVVFIDAPALWAYPGPVIEAALRGVDLSVRGKTR